jgi:hypothetical protein
VALCFGALAILPYAEGASQGEPLPATDLRLSIAHSPDPVGAFPWYTVTYTATVTNLGPETATGVLLNVPWVSPQYFTIDPGAATGCVTVFSGGCAIADLPPGAGAVVELRGWVDGYSVPAHFKVGFEVRSENADPNPADNVALEPTTVWPAAVSATCGLCFEGDSGVLEVPLSVSLDATHAHVQTVTVDYVLRSGTASAGVDFEAASGTLTFPPGVDSVDVPIRLIGDTVPEPHEFFTLELSNAVNALNPRPSTVFWILNDDGYPPGEAGLSHGFSRRGPVGAPGLDRLTAPYAFGSSYELVVDEVSGRAEPIEVVAGVPISSLRAGAVGTGSAKSLRWFTDPIFGDGTGGVWVSAPGCRSGGCGPDDGYRARFYETTLTGATTDDAPSVLILQNPGVERVKLLFRFFRDGQPSGDDFVHEIGPRASFVRTLPAGPILVTVAHDAPYGALVGKVVTVDPESGFVSESLLAARPH